MIVALTYISLIAGGLLVLILVVGIVGGLDLDLDLDFETNADPGVGMGVFKGGLTFLSIGAWVMKLLLVASANPVVAVVSGVAAGGVAVWLLSLVLRFLLRQESNVNWHAEDALFQPGEVYLRIPARGQGIVRVNVKGGMREMKARSAGAEDIPTGSKIFVEELADDGLLVVSPAQSPP